MKGMRKSTFVLVAAAALMSGCATTKASQGVDPNVISREEIVNAEQNQGVRNLYDIVKRLRPRWLNVRASGRSFGMSTEIAVYQNQTYLGNEEVLAQMGPTIAYELRWMDGQEAMNTLPGLGSGRHIAAAIIIVTKAPGS
jgi:hypothetical protein